MQIFHLLNLPGKSSDRHLAEMVGADAPQGVELQIFWGLVNYVTMLLPFLVLSVIFFSCKLQAVIYISLHGSILVAWDLEIYGVINSRRCQES